MSVSPNNDEEEVRAMLHYHYLPTLVEDRRLALEATARRNRLLSHVRRAAAETHRRLTLAPAAPAARTTADSATPRAA